MDRFGGFDFPIRRRGHFRTDDFFSDFHNDFDSAISGVMNRFGGRSLLADQFSSYRSLKDRFRDNAISTGGASTPDAAADDATTASISETKDNYVIVLDMSAYVQGSISVETKGRYACVDANLGPNVFRRKYPLPNGTNYEALVAALSDEGILTIKAPKKNSGAPKTSTTSISDGSFPSSLKIDMGESNRKDSVTSGKGKVVPLVLDGDVLPPTDERTETPPNTPTDDLDPHSPPPDDRKLSISKKGKFFQDEYFANVLEDFEKAMDEMVEKEQKKGAVSKEEVASQLQSELVKEAQEKQQHLLQEQLKRQKQEELLNSLKSSTVFERPLPNDRLSSYQNLRQWVPTDSQAATLTKDENGYKIVMDVKDFSSEGDLQIKGSDNGLVVSGSKGGISFERSFTLPGLSDPEKVSASMSEDGVLTVTAPIS